MSLKGWLQPYFAMWLTDEARLHKARAKAERRRKRKGLPHTITWYHRADDPYSHLLSQVLPDFLRRYPVQLEYKTVSTPPPATNPRPELLDSYGFRDAKELAAYYGLEMPGQRPTKAEITTAQLMLLELESREDYLEKALEIGTQLWEGQLDGAFAKGRGAEVESRLESNRGLLEKKGHYSSGMLYYEGEWYWGVDRLYLLEERLEALGVGEGRTLPEPKALSFDYDTSRLDFYLSVRSPYSYIALERVFALSEKYGVELNLKPILPMVLRGLPVPRSKRMYILLDVKREANRHDIPFGRICDPLGGGVERALAVFFYLQQEAGEDAARSYLRSVMQGIWTHGIEIAKDKGLRKVVERSGNQWSLAKKALSWEEWEKKVEQNRLDLEGLGMWGVPSFRLGDFSAWGQDRIWMLESLLKHGKSS